MNDNLSFWSLFIVVCLAFTIVFSVFEACNLQPAVAQQLESWPQWRYDVANTAYAPENTPPAKGETIWKTYVSGMVTSSPAVVDGKVYIGNNNDVEHKDYVFVWCLDAHDGSVIWKYQLPNQGPGGEETHFGIGWSSPAVVDGKVYIGALDHNVYCLDAAAGTLEWKYLTEGRVYSSPAVVDGKVYVGSEDQNVYCLDAASGTLIWNTTVPDVRFFSGPAVEGGKVYITGEYGLYAFDAKTGGLLWNLLTSDYAETSPTVAGGKVYFGSKNGSFFCLHAETGAPVWKHSFSGYCAGSSAIAYEKLFLGTGGLDIFVHALDADTGDPLWHYFTAHVVISSPAVVGGQVIVGSQDNWVHSIDQETGEREWRSVDQLGAWVWGSPAVVDGKVYVGSLNGYVYAIGDAAGVPTRVVKANDCLPVPPTIICDPIIVALAVAITFVGAVFYNNSWRWNIKEVKTL